MNISTLKLGWKYLTGGATSVLDYVLDVANNAVNGLQDATKEKIQNVLTCTKKILATAKAVRWLVPAKWLNDYDVTLQALGDVVSACEDLKITPEELTTVTNSWKLAYAEWRAE